VTTHANTHRASAVRGRFGVVLATCALLASVPSAGFALGALGSDAVVRPASRATIAKFTPADVDPRIARLLAQVGSSSKNRLMRFTPAGAGERANRSVTVAVRVDDTSARFVSVGSVLARSTEQAAATAPSELRLAPTRYNLGAARGYQSFAKPVVATPALSRTLTDAAIPDLASYRPSAGAAKDVSRFAPRKAVTEAQVAAAPRTVDSQRVDEPAVDVAGSYRLTRNLDVTAGVRYVQERERLAPITDTGKKDNQAVYLGTQFRF
jgi:hypothetical protein